MAHASSATQHEVFVKEHLLYVHAKAEAGEYDDALAALREAKGSAPANVYIRALEQQLGVLVDLSHRNTLTEERKQEILEPMSGIIERALASVVTLSADKGTPQSKNSPRQRSILSAEEKEEALEQLKVKYFEQAAQHLSAREYQLALGEIRRVFVIDPDNATAQQYESVIQELLTLELPSTDSTEAPASPRELMHEYERRLEHVSPLDDRVPPISPLENDAPADETVSPDTPEDSHEDPPPILRQPSALPVEPPRFEAHRPIAAEPPPVIHSLPDPVEEEPVVFSHERTVPTHRSRRFSLRLVIPIAAVLVVLTVVGAIALLPSRSPEEISFTTTSRPTVSSQPAAALNSNSPAPAGGAGSPSTSSSEDGSQFSIRPGPATSASDPAAGAQPKNTRPSQASHSPIPTPSVHTVPVVVEENLPPPPRTESSTPSLQGSPVTDSQNLTVAEPEPEPFIAVEKEPQLVKFETPQIPELAWQSGPEAKIVVRVMIDPDGKPVKTRVLKSNNTLVETAVLAAISKSTFTPGIMGKAPVSAWITLPLTLKRGD